MIEDIKKKHDNNSFEEILWLLLNAETSTRTGQENKYEINIEPNLYLRKLTKYVHDPREDEGAGTYHDKLREILLELVSLWAIESFEHSEKHSDVLLEKDDFSKKYGDHDWHGWEEIELCKKYSWKYLIRYNKEKIQLFKDIIYKNKERKFLCHRTMIKFLSKFHKELDIESFLDFLWIEEKYVFSDLEVLLLSIATTTRYNIARTFQYFYSLYVRGDDVEQFKGLISLEENVVMGNEEPKFVDKYKEFHFDRSLDGGKSQEWKNVTSGRICYESEKSLLKVDDKNISFKSSQVQKNLLELLLKNRGRHISSEEAAKVGVTAIKVTLQDIKRKLKKAGVDKLFIRQMFHQVDEKPLTYCRILL